MYQIYHLIYLQWVEKMTRTTTYLEHGNISNNIHHNNISSSPTIHNNNTITTNSISIININNSSNNLLHYLLKVMAEMTATVLLPRFLMEVRINRINSNNSPVTSFKKDLMLEMI